MTRKTTVGRVYRACVAAMADGKLISRISAQDKEFHFQNWFRTRLTETGLLYEQGGRNSYPDFRMVRVAEGYEVKGLAYPGREVTYDCNSQVPCGYHNGRAIFYAFGRYPARPDGDRYPVLDFVVCHGDFLNADHEYVHKNRSVRGFGSYGDIMIRDRKMYVAPTPFGVLSGVAHTQTLILPHDLEASADLKLVGEFAREEGTDLVVGYSFDLRENALSPETIPNPSAGREHVFRAWRVRDGFDEPVAMREGATADVPEDEEDVDD